MNAGSTPTKVLFIDHSEEGQSNMVKTKAPRTASPGAGRPH